MTARVVEAAGYEVREPRPQAARGPCCPICQGGLVAMGMALRCVRCGFQWCAGCGGERDLGGEGGRSEVGEP